MRRFKMTSTKPNIQRKNSSTTEMKKRRMMAGLSKGLRSEYGIRGSSLRKGDTVRIAKGDYKGHEGKVSSIDLPSMKITVEGVQLSKMDGTKKNVTIHPSQVTITKLDLSDKLRKKFFEGKKSKAKSEE
jgi:large subunit ribosomal protein L24